MSRIKKILIVALITLSVVPAASYLAWTIWLSNPAKAGPPVNYDAQWTALIESIQPIGEDAFPAYVAILEDRLGARRVQSLDMNGFPEWSHQGGDDLRALIDSDMRDALQGDWADGRSANARAAAERLKMIRADLDAAAALPRCERPHDPPDGARRVWWNVSSEYGPERDGLRHLAALNLVWMREAAVAGDWDEVVRRFETGLRLGRHALMWPSSWDWMLGLGFYDGAVREVRTLAHEHAIPTAVGERILEVIDRTPWRVAPEKFYLDGVAIELMGMSQDWYSGALTGGNTIPWPLQARQASEERRLEGHLQDIRAWRAMTGPQRAAHELPDLDLGTREVGIAMMVPATARPFRTFDVVETDIAATRVMLRLEAFHDRESRWPHTLEEAASADEIIEPITGDCFGYQRLEGDPFGRPFILIVPASAKHMRTDAAEQRRIVAAGGEAPDGWIDVVRRELPEVNPDAERERRELERRDRQQRERRASPARPVEAPGGPAAG